MHIQITAKNIDLTDAIRSYVNKKIGKVKKYFDQVIEVHVVLEVQKNLHIAEVLVNAKGVFLKGLEKSEDLYASIDLAVDKIERQLVKYKEKIQSKKLMNKDFEEPFKLNVIETGSLDTDNPVTVISKQIPVKPMDVEEAVMQMDLLNKNFFVFRNADSSEVNVVYKRDDGNIGLIEP
ncbi:sigma 54 modulation protein/ribosomal protein S30EA [Flexistipes sinusarabici DSM 4947]|uniref:Ribosome hibernation promoting factor n=2 Tax=Flexistipes sinusarabici TaxID=2352 RepID=F8E5L3_FLESM|nr:ribosome-associated translation inhibitor RaiA [Flexistipes sinusarabici]AEI14644.1 sigma 54 modulation protein/ribosomal protein S30EA [Flexistipes sinusarabici DSM 4947]HCW93597.1 ribosome-associated translation inhibitor RaiA [Flexistipes sinusarabici]